MSTIPSNVEGAKVASERIPLWSGQAPVADGITEEANAFITVHHPAKATGTALIICPGGGYGGLVVDSEGTGIAEWLNTHGIVGVVLEYRLPEGRPLRPLFDVQHAIRMVRSKANEWECNPKRIGIIGFSAGGHLAATAATHFNRDNSGFEDPLNSISCRPDFAVLIYPVIIMGPDSHNESKENLLGANPEDERVKLFSCELQVTAQTPPTFLAHAMDDRLVTPRNSQVFYDALITHNVPAEYLKLPSGGHGLNGYRGPMWDAWQAQSLQWLKNVVTQT